MSMLRQSALAAVAALGLAFPVMAQDWGTVKGVVTWGGKEPPKAVKLDVNKDQAHCLSKGDILSEEFVVGKSGGVKNVFVWLTDAENPKKKLPVHPSLKAARDKEVTLDQPCCRFEPHVLAVREGQTVVAKNSSPVAHNINWQGGADNPGDNKIIPPNGQIKIELTASPRPIAVSCNIHPWMRGWMRVFDHPYFAVTDEDGKFEIKNAPAGKYNLVMWQEGVGWVNGGKVGKAIEIPAGGALELKEQVKPE